jgi:hypothetical protein
VKLANGTAVTGLTQGSFTIALKRWSGTALVAASEAVTLTELSGGDYQVTYTPTLSALYRLTVVPTNVLNLPNPDDAMEDDVQAGTSATGPYLTTRAAFKVACNILNDASKDAAIDALLPQVTDQIQGKCGRIFAQATLTEYPEPLAAVLTRLFVARPPIASITSLHLSSGIPRIYDATTLLTEGTDFIQSDDGRSIELVAPRYLFGPLAKIARLIYVGGYSPIPGDVERAAQEILAAKLSKATGTLYHLAGSTLADGQLQGVRFDDMTPNALEVIERYQLAVSA